MEHAQVRWFGYSHSPERFKPEANIPTHLSISYWNRTKERKYRSNKGRLRHGRREYRIFYRDVGIIVGVEKQKILTETDCGLGIVDRGDLPDVRLTHFDRPRDRIRKFDRAT